ncbi:MAG: hypothetical protein ABI536_05765 [Gallionella sp.]
MSILEHLINESSRLKADIELNLTRSSRKVSLLMSAAGARKYAADIEQCIADYEARQRAQGCAIRKVETIKRDSRGEMELISTEYQY